MNSFRVPAVACAVLILLVWAAPGFAAEAVNPMMVDPDLAIFTAITFVLLLLVLWKFAWGPIATGLDKREKTIADEIAAAEQANQEAKALLAQYQSQLAAATNQVKEMIAQGRRDAEAIKERTIAEARTAAQRERDRALSDIHAAKESALREIAQKSVDIAITLAGRIVDRQVTATDHARLIREALEQFPSRN